MQTGDIVFVITEKEITYATIIVLSDDGSTDGIIDENIFINKKTNLPNADYKSLFPNLSLNFPDSPTVSESNFPIKNISLYNDQNRLLYLNNYFDLFHRNNKRFELIYEIMIFPSYPRDQEFVFDTKSFNDYINDEYVFALDNNNYDIFYGILSIKNSKFKIYYPEYPDERTKTISKTKIFPFTKNNYKIFQFQEILRYGKYNLDAEKIFHNIIDIHEFIRIYESSYPPFSKITDLEKCNHHNIFKNAGIFTYLCKISKNTENLFELLFIQNPQILSKQFFKKFGIKYIDFFEYVKKINFFDLRPSIGMSVAERVFSDENFKIDDNYLELIDEQNSCNFEMYFIHNHSECKSILHSYTSSFDFCSFRSIKNIIDTKKKKADFISFEKEMIEYNNKFPDCFKSVEFLEQVSLNKNLALVFLCGSVYMNNVGIDSFHLSGTMTPSVREFNTGFIVFEENKEAFPGSFYECFDFLKKNNYLYENVETLTKNDMYSFTLRLKDKIGAKSAIVLPDQDQLSNEQISHYDKKNKQLLIKIRCKENGEIIELPFEHALASMFPFLFPFGPVDIPGKTLRKKTQNLLLSHIRFRVGPVASQMILFCFDAIVRSENYFFQNLIKPKQNVIVESGTDRTIPICSMVKKEDPSFPFYWKIQLNNVNAYCEQFGTPDLMITLTFGNKWSECHFFIESVKKEFPDLNHSNLDMIYAGVESMFLFKEKLKKISNKKFQKFLELSNLPKCLHYIIRLEFQNRGSPHVHCLLWLENRLTLDDIKCHFFGYYPPEEAEYLNNIVRKQMTHQCKHPRCFSGLDPDKCKYGFPKMTSYETYYDDDGHLIYQRTVNDERCVEHSPALLLLWGAHAHVHILKSQDSDLSNNNDSVIYVLKYNMKSEPNINIVASDNISWKTVFKSRVVSLEEASARIFSMSFCQKDLMCKFIDTSIPEKRKAIFDNFSKQKNFDDVECYFNRPELANDLTILEFYSQFDVEYIQNNRNINSYDKKIVSKKGSIKDLYYIIKKRNVNTIITFRNFDFHSQKEEFLYHYLLIQEPRRSEIIPLDKNAGYGSLIKKSVLKKLEESNIDKYVYSYIEYLIDFERYSEDFIVNKVIHILNEGHDLNSIIFILCSLCKVQDENRENIDDNLNYDLTLGKNKRIVNVIGKLKSYIEAVDSTNTINGNLDNNLIMNRSEEEMTDANKMFLCMLNNMNDDQKFIINNIIDIFPIRAPIFISGKAGTGKSYILNCLKNYFISKNISFCVTASTGIASILIGGKTLHSCFSIFCDDDEFHSGLTHSSHQGKILGNCEVLFIDEISMINYKILELVNKKLKELRAQVKKNKNLLNSPFGGVMVIMFGDLAQVPCVTKNADDSKEFLSMFNNYSDFNKVHIYSLQKLVRQDIGENDPFYVLLEEIRNYKNNQNLSINSINLIKKNFVLIQSDKCYFEKIYKFVGDDGMAIFYRNTSCDNYNNIIVNHIASSKSLELFKKKGDLIAIIKGSFIQGNPVTYKKMPATEKDYKFYHSYHKRCSSCLAPYVFTFFIGARVMLLKNIDANRGLVNGRRGTITNVFKDKITGNPVVVSVFFDEISDFKQQLEDIRIVKMDTFNHFNGKTFNFYQFPLKICYSVTAHKAQGQTLEKVAIAIDEPAFAHGAFYVAISRVKKFENALFFGKEFPPNGPQLHTNEFISNFNFQINHNI